MASIQEGLGQYIHANAILLSERTSAIVNKLALGYVLQLEAMAIRGINCPMRRLKIILSGESRKNYELRRVILMRTSLNACSLL